jgi:putative ABC transport system permease protein
MNLDPRTRRIRDEMRHHLEELEAHLEAEGLSTEEARSEAARRFGDPDAIAGAAPGGEARARWRTALDGARQDLGHALRQMRRHPLSSGLTIATLTVGVAATTIVFSVVHAVVLAPLPFEAPDGLVHVSQTSPQGRLYSTSEPNFVDFRARQQSFTEMAAMGWQNPVLTGAGDPTSIDGRRVSHTFFPLLGIEPVLGRNFSEQEDRFGGPGDVVLLSAGTWERRFGADPDVVGRSIVLDGVGREVVGIVPSDRSWPGVEVFMPLAPNPDVYRDDQRLETLARLRPGVSIDAARQDMVRIAAALSDEYPESNDGWGASVRPIREWLVGARLTRLGGLLLGSVALFLLMACASVSNLLLARASVRAREMGVRTALGAGRGRIGAQLAAEGLILAVVGGGLALVLAYQGLDLVRALGPGDIARLAEADVDARALGVAGISVIGTVLLAGIAPALLLLDEDAFALLRIGGRAGAGGRRLRDSLVVAQFALAVTVVSGAALLTRSFVELQQVELGFEASSVVRFAVRLSDARFDQITRAEYLDRLTEELSAIPGVEAVGSTTAGPFSPMRPSNFVARSDQEPDRQEGFQPVSWRAVSPDYFDAAGIPLLSGRVFDVRDRVRRGEQVQNPPVIIDRTLADLLFPGEDPVGRLVTWFLPGGVQCEIIGVVATARDERLDVEPRPRIYRPFTFTAWDQPTVLVRVAGDPAAIIPLLREATLGVDPDTPAIGPTVISDDVQQTVAWPRFSMQVLGAFGLIALILAAMGIYGVTSFSVARRRHEIGVRVALGAEPSRVHWMVVRRALRLAGAGILAGLIVALLLGRSLEALLYDVSSNDPLTFVAVPVAMTLLAVVSTWIPARRAVGLDPREALIEE